MSIHLIRRSAVCAAVAVAAIASGCASPAVPANMAMRATDATTARQATPEAFKTNVAIKEVTGGKATNPAWMSNVGSADFERALEDSLRSVGMLASSRESGRYLLTANLAKLEQPMFGFDMTVTSTVTYALIERASGKTVWTKSLDAPFTAKTSDAFVGTERLRLANEGSIRESISRVIRELQAVKVADVSVK